MLTNFGRQKTAFAVDRLCLVPSPPSFFPSFFPADTGKRGGGGGGGGGSTEAQGILFHAVTDDDDSHSLQFATKFWKEGPKGRKRLKDVLGADRKRKKIFFSSSYGGEGEGHGEGYY